MATVDGAVTLTETTGVLSGAPAVTSIVRTALGISAETYQGLAYAAQEAGVPADAFAGIMWSQVQNGLASGFLQTNPTGNGVASATTGQKANNIDPGVGLRYQF